ncbi:hypothetical protein RJ639_042349 [Escallonia herrerae]|uniref:Uncharacterized protein n=1 Tax=Escallonia herrerae TaxID=1293975 RepID=A0AA88WL85_9ASTE|nr:hypothetical protein RJ639_042349 [Escallonia herrerae]
MLKQKNVGLGEVEKYVINLFLHSKKMTEVLRKIEAWILKKQQSGSLQLQEYAINQRLSEVDEQIAMMALHFHPRWDEKIGNGAKEIKELQATVGNVILSHNNPVKWLTSKPVLIQHPLTCKRAAKKNAEKEGGILLSFHAHRIITSDNLKCLLCIPDKTLEIHRHRPRIITSGSNLRPQLESICFKLLDFCIKHIAELPNCFQILNMFW